MHPIFEAISDGDLSRIREIVREDLPAVNTAVDEFGQPPLVSAIRDVDRQFEIIQFLVESGADVNHATPEGYTPLHLNIDLNGPSASGEMPYRVARLLKEHGANVEAVNHYGWTPLMRAALEGTPDEFNALLQIGADFDLVYASQSLPMFTRGRPLASVILPWPRKVQMLLRVGFEPSRSLVEDARNQLADAHDPESIFSRGVRESIEILERAIAGR